MFENEDHRYNSLGNIDKFRELFANAPRMVTMATKGRVYRRRVKMAIFSR